jgi:diaminopimelate decarboxylase
MTAAPDFKAEDLVSRHHDLLRKIAAEHGSAYVYDLDAMRSHAIGLRALFAPARLYYAMKANPLVEVIQTLAGVVNGIEIASGGELHYLRSVGVAPDNVLFAGPAKSIDEIGAAIRSGVHALHVESVEELQTAVAIRAGTQSKTLLAIRVNTKTSVDTPFDKMVGGPSRFGLDEEQLAGLASTNILNAIDGIHLYSGSQIRNWRVIADQFYQASRIAAELQERLGTVFRYANLGGGFGVPHAPADQALAVQPLAARLRELTPVLPAEIALELGRYLTAPFGAFVTRVSVTKRSRGTTFALVDSGYNGFLRPMLTGEAHRIVPLGDVPGGSRVIVGGPLCTPTDTFGVVDAWTPRPGDSVAILNAGAYGWSMSPQFFLGHPTPAEIVIEGGEAHVARARVEAYEYLRLGRTS